MEKNHFGFIRKQSNTTFSNITIIFKIIKIIMLNMTCIVYGDSSFFPFGTTNENENLNVSLQEVEGLSTQRCVDRS